MKLFFPLILILIGVTLVFLCAADGKAQDAFSILLGKDYHGAKCAAAVGDFAVQISGAPAAVGDGLREMLMTALFESNYFEVLERMNIDEISAEQLLSNSFMADPDAILNDIGMVPAEVMIYGTLVDLEGGGMGLRVKIPWAPMTVGGKYHKARAVVEIKAVDSATGRIIAVDTIEGSAVSTASSIGTTLKGISLPVELEMIQNTPLELCIRDSILRGVVKLCRDIPKEYFKH